ncbi:hypothetical protein FXO38_15222 [Capsicum annuum]|nr:hypothetical protein FXO37_27766 [Capsicum annuum]KAF3654258.1 hypothetical protein FXO38_15222 [Capsicum annuum]
MSRILHKIEEKLHIHHHKHGDDPAAAQNKSEETHEVNDESNIDKKEDIDDHDKKKNLVKKIAGKITKKLLHGHHKNSRESDPPDKNLNSALLLSRRTYPPRNSWNFCGLHLGKSTKARKIDSTPNGSEGTKTVKQGDMEATPCLERRSTQGAALLRAGL